MIPCNRCKCSSVERRGLYKSCCISECLCLTVPIPSEANRKWFHQLMFGNISPVQCVEARPGFLLSGAELSQSSADSGATTLLLLLLQWVISSLQSVRLALLHRWSVMSVSIQQGGLHSRPCTDSQRTNTDTDITDIFLVLKNIYFNTQGQVIPREPWQWQC